MESRLPLRPTDAAPGRRQPRDARTARAADGAPPRRSATPWILVALAAGGRRGGVALPGAAARPREPTPAAAGIGAAGAANRDTARAAGTVRRRRRRRCQPPSRARRPPRRRRRRRPCSPAQKALEDQAQRAGAEARAVFEKAKEAVGRRAHHGGRGAHRRGARRASGLENAERVTGDDGATYVGQVADGKRQGLGVLEFKDGDRQAGEWKDNILNGLGIEQLSDGPRYEGQWSNGLPAGLGVREKPGSRARRRQLRRRAGSKGWARGAC